MELMLRGDLKEWDRVRKAIEQINLAIFSTRLATCFV